MGLFKKIGETKPSSKIRKLGIAIPVVLGCLCAGLLINKPLIANAAEKKDSKYNETTEYIEVHGQKVKLNEDGSFIPPKNIEYKEGNSNCKVIKGFASYSYHDGYYNQLDVLFSEKKDFINKFAKENKIEVILEDNTKTFVEMSWEGIDDFLTTNKSSYIFTAKPKNGYTYEKGFEELLQNNDIPNIQIKVNIITKQQQLNDKIKGNGGASFFAYNPAQGNHTQTNNTYYIPRYSVMWDGTYLEVLMYAPVYTPRAPYIVVYRGTAVDSDWYALASGTWSRWGQSYNRGIGLTKKADGGWNLHLYFHTGSQQVPIGSVANFGYGSGGVSYNSNGGSGSVSGENVPYGWLHKVQSGSGLSKFGHSFHSWTTNSNGSGTRYYPGNEFRPFLNRPTLYAQWTPNNYHVDLNGTLDGKRIWGLTDVATVDLYINGSLVANDVIDYGGDHPYGAKWEIRDIKCKPGYRHTGGTLSGTIGGNVDINPTFETVKYTITVNPNGGTYKGKSTNTTYTSFSGDKIELNDIPTRDGYKFKGWKYEGAGSLHSGNYGWMGEENKSWITMTEKTDSDGTKYSNYVVDLNNTMNGYRYPNFAFFTYPYTVGHTYRVSADVRIHSVSGMEWATIRHSAFYNDYESANGVVGLPMNLPTNGWEHKEVSRTFTSSTLTQAGTTYQVDPRMEFYCAVPSGQHGRMNFDVKNVVVFDVTTGQYVTSKYESPKNGALVRVGNGNGTATAVWEKTHAHNHVLHWAWGFKNQEGNNGNKNAFLLGGNGEDHLIGSSILLDDKRALRIPNGFKLDNEFGTSSVTGSWQHYPMGSYITQTSNDMSFEYDYRPIEYKIHYNLNGGSNHSSNPSTYNVLYGVTLKAPTRTGYTFKGWKDTATGQIITGINEGQNASFNNPDDMYRKLESRTTGDVTLEALWESVSYNIHYDAQGGQMPGSYPTTYTSDKGVQLPTPTKNGYTFKGWRMMDKPIGSLDTSWKTGNLIQDTPYYEKYEYRFEKQDQNKTLTEFKVTAWTSPSQMNRWSADVAIYVDGNRLGTITVPKDNHPFYGSESYSTKINIPGYGAHTVVLKNEMTNKEITQFRIDIPKPTGSLDQYPLVKEIKPGTVGDKYMVAEWAKADALQTVRVRFENADGTFTPYRQAYQAAHAIGSTFEWTYPQSNYYESARVSYTVTGAKTTDVTVRRRRYNFKVVQRIDGKTVLPQDAVGTFAFNYEGQVFGTDVQTIDVTLVAGQTFSIYNMRTKEGYTYKGATPTDKGEVTSNMTVYLDFTTNSIVATFDPNGGTTPNPTTITKPFKAPLGTLPTTSRQGYIFQGWYTAKSGGTKIDATTTMPSKNVTYYAQWKPISYTIHYNGNGNTINTPAGVNQMNDSDHVYDVAKNLSKNQYVRTGWDFVGWNTRADGQGKLYKDGESVKNLTTKDKDVVQLYAQWEPKGFMVVFHPNGGTTPTPFTEKEGTQGEPIGTFPTTSRKGYTFKGWYDQTSGGSQVNEHTVLRVKLTNVYAQWEKDGYTISYDYDGATPVDNPEAYDVDTPTFTLKNPTRPGYRFDGWTGSNGTTPQTTVTIPKGSTGNKNYKANWTPIFYTIHYNGNGSTSGSTADSSHTYDVAKKLTKNGFMKKNAVFLGWNTRADGKGKMFLDEEPVMNLTETHGTTIQLYAQWEMKEVTLHFNGNGGTDAPDIVGYAGNPIGTLPESKRDGYTFDGWYTAKSGGTKISADTLIPGDETTYYAHWVAKGYTISYDLNGGKVSGNPATYKTTDADITLKNPTRTGYTFIGWTGTGLNGPTMTVKIPKGSIGDRSYTANWRAHEYTIQYHGNNETSGNTASSHHTYDMMKNLTDNGFVRTGYTFAGWNTKSDGSGASYKNAEAVKNLTAEDGATVHLYARWRIKRYTVTFNPNMDASSNTVTIYAGTREDTLHRADGSTYRDTTGGTRTKYVLTFHKADHKKGLLSVKIKGLFAAFDGSIRKVESTKTSIVDFDPSTVTKKLTFDPTGGVCDTTELKFTVNSTLPSLPVPKREGYTFDGWFTEPDGGTEVTTSTPLGEESFTVYAHWTTKTYTVTYKGNNGLYNGTDSWSETIQWGVDYRTQANFFEQPGHTFVGWNTKSDGTGEDWTAWINRPWKWAYDHDVTLYAIWK